MMLYFPCRELIANPDNSVSFSEPHPSWVGRKLSLHILTWMTKTLKERSSLATQLVFRAENGSREKEIPAKSRSFEFISDTRIEIDFSDASEADFARTTAVWVEIPK